MNFRNFHPYAALLLLLVFATVGFGGGSRSYQFVKEVILPVSDAGDTARVIQFTPTSALDSFDYWDSIAYTADTSLWDTAHWISPLQVMYLTPVVDTSLTYVCSVAFAAQTLGFTYVCPEDDTLGNLVTALTDSINNVADLTDSVTAQDSGTYVKIISNFSQETFTARWSMVLGDSLDTASAITTTAMICDSMSAAINALDSAKYWTAANSGDTGYTITSDDKGLTIWAAAKDTAQDTATTVENAISSSRVTDTLKNLFSFLTDTKRPSAMYGYIIINPSPDTGAGNGLGASDSAYLRLMTTMRVDSNVVYYPLNADSAAALPCTLFISRINATGFDTLYKNGASLIYEIMDTLTDDNYPAYYRISVDLNILDY